MRGCGHDGDSGGHDQSNDNVCDDDHDVPPT